MIQIHDLSFGYSKQNLLFKNLHLSLSSGHIYGLLGKNGAGKSTLLKNIIGLAFPLKGLVQINGVKTASRSPQVLESLYFIPEEIYVPSVTSAQFVNSTAGFYPLFNEMEFYDYLQEFEIPRESVLDKLSYGQQKKVMIAFGLATNTPLLVMDEPTNGLDIPSKVQFRKIIASALTEERCIIISTHQVRDLDSLIDTLVVLHNQEIVLNQPLDAIAEKVTFTTVQNPADYDVLYAEESLRGQHVIIPNHEGNYGKVDLELLFNALINGQIAITEYLNKPVYAKPF